MKNSARGDSSTGSELKAVEEACRNGDLLAPRRQERQVRKFNFFAAFAPLREIFRVFGCSSAALGLWVNTSSQETQNKTQMI
jgi:hypothetical protein